MCSQTPNRAQSAQTISWMIISMKGGYLAVIFVFYIKLLRFLVSGFFPFQFLLGVWCAPTGFFSCLRSFVILRLFLTVYELPGRHTFIPDEDLVFFRLPQQLHLCLMELVLINHPAGWKRNTPANPAWEKQWKEKFTVTMKESATKIWFTEMKQCYLMTNCQRSYTYTHRCEKKSI